MDAITAMLLTRGEVPGMPAVGHVAGGYWHPGPKHNCSKGNCPTPKEKR